MCLIGDVQTARRDPAMPKGIDEQVALVVDLLLKELQRRIEEGRVPIRQPCPVPHKGLFTTQEAADYLGMPRGGLYAAVSRRQIPYVKLGRRLRFREEDLKSMVEKSVVEPIGDIPADGRRGRRRY